MAAGEINPIPDLLDSLYQALLPHADGVVASYIPELSHADPAWFGLALATLDGHVYAAGEAERKFTMQSVSKPFVYALALADRGLDEVVTKVGIESSGDTFNAIRLEPGTGRPANPMINAGAILTTSLVDGGFDRVLAGLSAFAGNPLTVDDRVFASELATGDRNRALAYLMRNAGALQADVDEALSVYFRQCAVEVTARDLAVMSATLANGGINPVNGTLVIDRDTASHVLSVMATCGMYDFSGQWLLRVGLPAKSGVSGGIAASLPAQFGIGIFSPPLDERGTSVRGIAVCEELSSRFGLHLMRPADRTAATIHLAGMRRHDSSTIVVALQGDIGFDSSERVARALASNVKGTKAFVLDLDRVGRLHPVAQSMLDSLAQRLAANQIEFIVVDSHDRTLLRHSRTRFPTLDEALRWCEDQQR